MAESASVFLPTTNNQPDGGQQPRWVSHVFIAQKFKRHNFAWYEIQMTWNPNYYSLITKTIGRQLHQRTNASKPVDKCLDGQMSAPRFGPGKCPHQDGVQANVLTKRVQANVQQINVRTRFWSRQMSAPRRSKQMSSRQMSAPRCGPG